MINLDQQLDFTQDKLCIILRLQTIYELYQELLLD